MPFGEQREHHVIERGALRHTQRVLEHPAGSCDALAFHAACIWFLPARQNRQQRGLPTTGRPADCGCRSRFHTEIKMLEQ